MMNDNTFTLSVKSRDGITFNKLIERLKSHGFNGEMTIADKQFDGVNGKGKECLISYSSETGFYIIQIEDEKESESEQTASKIERLTKRMEEISKEIQAHPEKAEELQEEMLDISIELQEESLKIQEKMLEQ
jgi:hypothetical protein